MCSEAKLTAVMNQRGKRNRQRKGPQPPKSDGHRNSNDNIQNPRSGSADHADHPKDSSGKPVGKVDEVRIGDKSQKEASSEMASDKKYVQKDVGKKELESVTIDSKCTNSECIREKAQYVEEIRQHKEAIKQLEEKLEQLTSKDCHQQNNADKEIMDIDTSTTAPINVDEEEERIGSAELPQKKHKLRKKEAKEDTRSKKDKSLKEAVPESWADDKEEEEEKYVKSAHGIGIQQESCSDSMDYWPQDNRGNRPDQSNDWTQGNAAGSQQGVSRGAEAENTLRRHDTDWHDSVVNLPPTNTKYDRQEKHRNGKEQSTYYGARPQDRRNRSSSRDERPHDKYQKRGDRACQGDERYQERGGGPSVQGQQCRSREWTNHQGEQPMKRKRVLKEIEGDLFTAPKTFSLAHCVAEDMRMGSGIAVTFRQMFKRVDELLAQGARTGGVAVLENEGRFIYYLVTKKLSNGKPQLEDLRSSLLKMREHMHANSVHDVAMPRIGCGLDRLEWQEVRGSLIEIFGEDDVNITVYNFNQEQGQRNQPRSSLWIRHLGYSLADIQNGTGLLYLGSEDGAISESLQSLLAKYPILQQYKQSERRVGHFVRTVCKNEVLYGLIVKEKDDDEFSFTTFSQCLENLRSVIRHDGYEHVGIDVIAIGDDLQLATEKLITVFKNAWFRSNLNLYICWPKEYISIHKRYYQESQKYTKQ